MNTKDPIENDPEKSKPVADDADKDSLGQNPFWPGDKALQPGKSKEPPDDTETNIPLVR